MGWMWLIIGVAGFDSAGFMSCLFRWISMVN